jgi:uncharacterized membrane protein YccC
VALTLTLSLLDRTPRGYVFMLAGYTAAIIGFPSVNAPSGEGRNLLARFAGRSSRRPPAEA